ncbi:MAG: hypothetical protein KAR87_05630 [Candidatus Aenigmarchaeota archaeon]|nr:hypothetical protein [Candidatus Aenigmarchaeota archaeon]
MKEVKEFISTTTNYHTFITIISVIVCFGIMYLFWYEYLPMKESKTTYGIFIGVLFFICIIGFVFGSKKWKKIEDKEIKDKEEKRKLELEEKKLELERKRLENKKLKDELDTNDGYEPTLTSI